MSHLLRQPATDLFGEVVVTDTDIWDWVASISPIHLHERGFALYVQRYDVAGKVARSKLAGTFEAYTSRRPPPFHFRFDLHRLV